MFRNQNNKSHTFSNKACSCFKENSAESMRGSRKAIAMRGRTAGQSVISLVSMNSATSLAPNLPTCVKLVMRALSTEKHLFTLNSGVGCKQFAITILSLFILSADNVRNQQHGILQHFQARRSF
mgnify:CR=1 FL=1